jgi:large subunit ribosomal protein L3
MAILDDGAKLTPRSGYKHFTVLRSPCVVLSGSVPGTPKRPLVLRAPAKSPKRVAGPPKVVSFMYGGEVLAS